MSNNEFRFNLDSIYKPGIIKSADNNHIIKTASDMIAKSMPRYHRAHPEFLTCKILTVYKNNTFDVQSLDDAKTYLNVPSITPDSWMYYQPGQTVNVRYYNVDSDRMYIRFGQGYSGAAVDLSNPPIPPSTEGLWIQGGFGENVSSLSTKGNGVFKPCENGGPVPNDIYGVNYTNQLERPLGLIAYNSRNGEAQVAWVTSEDAGSGNHTTRLYVIDLPSGNYIYSLALETHTTYSDAAHLDYGVVYENLYFDRQLSYIVFIGSQANQYKVWAVDTDTRTLIVNGQSFPISLHQSNVGYGHIYKTWTTTARDPSLYPNDRPQQDRLWRFYRAQTVGGVTSYAGAGTVDPQAFLPGYEICVTKGRGQLSGFFGDAEMGHSPLTSIGETVNIISGWKMPGTGFQDAWMNAGMNFSLLYISGTSQQQPVMFINYTQNLIGGHRLQDSVLVYYRPLTNSYIKIQLPTNTPTPVEDTTSINAWADYYTSLAISGSFYIAGAVNGSTFGGFYGGKSTITFNGLANSGSLDLAGEYTVVSVERDSLAPCYTPVSDTSQPFAKTGLVAAGNSNYPLTAGSGFTGDPPGTFGTFILSPGPLPYPDYNHFYGGHQMMLPCPRVLGGEPADILILWPLFGTDSDSSFKDTDPIDGIALDSYDSAYFARIEPYIIKQGDGYLVPQYTGNRTNWSNGTSFIQCDGLGPDGTTGTYWEVHSHNYSPDFSTYLACKTVQAGKTILYKVNKEEVIISKDISNYLDYYATTPLGTNTLSTLKRTPLDPTLWKPIVLESINVLMLVRAWRNTLYPDTLNTEHQPYIRVELYTLDTLTFIQHYEMPEYLDTVVITDGYGNTSNLRKWQFLENLSPILIKGSMNSGNTNPHINIFIKGDLNNSDGTSQTTYRCWQFDWTSGSVVQNIYDMPNTYYQPTDTIEQGSLMFAGNKAWFLKQNGSQWVLRRQDLT